jgi:hypothetical protein
MEGDTGDKAYMRASYEFTSVFTRLFHGVKKAELVCVGVSAAYVLCGIIDTFLLFISFQYA